MKFSSKPSPIMVICEILGHYVMLIIYKNPKISLSQEDGSVRLWDIPLEKRDGKSMT